MCILGRPQPWSDSMQAPPWRVFAYWSLEDWVTLPPSRRLWMTCSRPLFVCACWDYRQLVASPCIVYRLLSRWRRSLTVCLARGLVIYNWESVRRAAWCMQSQICTILLPTRLISQCETFSSIPYHALICVIQHITVKWCELLHYSKAGL